MSDDHKWMEEASALEARIRSVLCSITTHTAPTMLLMEGLLRLQKVIILVTALQLQESLQQALSSVNKSVLSSLQQQYTKPAQKRSAPSVQSAQGFAPAKKQAKVRPATAPKPSAPQQTGFHEA